MYLYGGGASWNSPGHRTRHGEHRTTDVLALPKCFAWPKNLAGEWLSLMDPCPAATHLPIRHGDSEGKATKKAGRKKASPPSYNENLLMLHLEGCKLRRRSTTQKVCNSKDYKNSVKSWKPTLGDEWTSRKVKTRFHLCRTKIATHHFNVQWDSFWTTNIFCCL